MLRERNELLQEINNTWEYQSTFIKWTEEQQNDIAGHLYCEDAE